MKNAISYYYNLQPINIHQSNHNYFFKTSDAEYALLKTTRKKEEIIELYYICNYLFKTGIYIHQLTLNKSSEVITNITDSNYILLRIYVKNRPININDINQLNINLNYQSEHLLRNDWHKLWCDKVDHLEEIIIEYGKKYPILRDSFNYYVGLAENAISLIRDKTNNNLTLSHYRISIKDTLFELYNPLTFIIDSKVRDACEYFKNAFFNKQNIENQILSYLFTLNKEDMYIFYARMFYPSYYFDIFEEIIKEISPEDKIEKIIIRVNEYEKLLNVIYDHIKEYVGTIEIDWLNKKVG